MSFGAFESSLQSSRPVELYEFTYQGIHLYHTSADRDITVGAVTYIASSLTRTAITDTTDIAKSAITITAEPHFEIAELFDFGPPDDVVGLVIKRFQNDDPAAEVKTFWLGRVVNCAWPSGQSTLRCESIYTALRQPGLRRPYSKNCTFVLYDAMCQADILTFQASVIIDSQVGNLINSAAFAAFPRPLAGGRIYWEKTPGFFIKRGIKNQSGSQIEVTHEMQGLGPGTTVVIAPGCDHSFGTCGSEFSNQINYGGAPNMQQKNPFGQSNVF